MIDSAKIKKNLNTKLISRRIFHYEVLDSTNIEAFRLINDSKAQFGDIIISNTQTSGKGQQDHKWNSPSGGIYLSIITASKVTESSNLITFSSGISCIKAIQKVTGIKPSLKWVNDILISNQKLGGILTESITQGYILTQVTGIGINANTKITNVFDNKYSPVSLAELTGGNIDINLLVAEICNSFEEYFNIYQQNPEQILNEWITNSRILRKNITFLDGNTELTGLIKGMNRQGHLSVEVNNRHYIITSSRDVII